MRPSGADFTFLAKLRICPAAQIISATILATVTDPVRLPVSGSSTQPGACSLP
jgi:hypothetical protein